MPTLPGFLTLKKKKTREGNTDSSSASNPTSPVTPTASTKTIDQQTTPLPAPQPVAVQASSSLAAAVGRQDAQPQEADPSVMNTLPLQPPFSPPFSPPQHTPSPGTGPQQNPPHTSNLINPPQHEGNTPYMGEYNPADGGAVGVPQPGGMASSQQQQQFQQQQQQLPQQMQQQQQQMQQHHLLQQQHIQYQGMHSTPIQQLEQPRVTKGKYSLADFDILRTLGTGSFGRVHLVRSKHNQRFYAVKVLKKAQVVKMKQVEHTNDERRMLGEVKNPFLITLWGTFQDSRNLYMVMDFVEGGELFSLLRKSGRFPNPVAKFYAAEVTLALEYLHQRNIIYRDLKPENLLLDRHGHLKITDFGFAKRVPDKTWTLCGTPDYLAPEVVSNKGYNKSVDWWSLGILIYEMLCGYTPFWDSGSPIKIYENILRGKVKFPAYINPDAKDLLEKLITADLTKRLGNLYGGSRDVKDHQWFQEVTWDRLARKDIDPPYTPPVKAGAGDASQFDRYPEDTEEYGQTGHDEFGHLFVDF
ncbi:kinase-like domain-containing protein [Cercophora newfieldiana]|uniref:cAMP-dependent protein kinase n=1 Tax=Cercophora newfieldiana TaxID=92897 RepID=A0AA39Y5S6_9PEZI|nr:kinase-like domain-containing protein [Cercophora newfieldiana]